MNYEWGMCEDVQAQVTKLWSKSNTKPLFKIVDLASYKHDFLNLFGFTFAFEGVICSIPLSY